MKEIWGSEVMADVRSGQRHVMQTVHVHGVCTSVNSMHALRCEIWNKQQLLQSAAHSHQLVEYLPDQPSTASTDSHADHLPAWKVEI